MKGTQQKQMRPWRKKKVTRLASPKFGARKLGRNIGADKNWALPSLADLYTGRGPTAAHSFGRRAQAARCPPTGPLHLRNRRPASPAPCAPPGSMGQTMEQSGQQPFCNVNLLLTQPQRGKICRQGRGKEEEGESSTSKMRAYLKGEEAHCVGGDAAGHAGPKPHVQAAPAVRRHQLPCTVQRAPAHARARSGGSALGAWSQTVQSQSQSGAQTAPIC